MLDLVGAVSIYTMIGQVFSNGRHCHVSWHRWSSKVAATHSSKFRGGGFNPFRTRDTGVPASRSYFQLKSRISAKKCQIPHPTKPTGDSHTRLRGLVVIHPVYLTARNLRPLGDAVITWKALAGHRRSTALRLLGLYPYEEQKGLN